MTIVVPEHYRTHRILSIDPGLSSTGIAIYELTNSFDILSIDAYTVHPNSKKSKIIFDEEIVGDRYIRLECLRGMLREIVLRHGPEAVACEGPFYSAFRPRAYGSLVETVNFIKLGIYDTNPYLPIEILQPLTIKRIIGAGSTKGKLDVTKAVSSNDEIMKALIVDINTLDEHSIDAIAIGYSYLKIIEELK